MWRGKKVRSRKKERREGEGVMGSEGGVRCGQNVG